MGQGRGLPRRPRHIKLQLRTWFRLPRLMPRDRPLAQLLYLVPLSLLRPFASGELKRDTFRRFGPLGSTGWGTPAPAGPTVDLTRRYRWMMDPRLKL